VTEQSVVLVSEAGQPIGARPKSQVHTRATPLHLAFSLYLFDGDDRLLLTRRALEKRTWPGVWTNTCCGHPAPGEQLEDAVRRRVREELGLDLVGLSCVLPDFAYRAVDASGIMENEICPVYRAEMMHPWTEPTPNAAEVMDWTWAPWSDVVSAVGATPFVFSPWSVLQVQRLAGS